MPSVCTVSPSPARISWAFTTNEAPPPDSRTLPRRLSSMPGSSTLASHGWLNQTPIITPERSRSTTLSRVTRRRRPWSSVTRSTVALTVASSPTLRSAMGLRSVKSS